MKLPPPTDENGHLNVVIETPRGSRNKYKYDEATGLFMLGKILPTGSVFPVDFGFVPGTKAADGDPLDVMVYTEDALMAGCLAQCRPIGIIEVEQSKNGKQVRNDRIVAIPVLSKVYEHIHLIDELPKVLVKEWVTFFAYYQQMNGNSFRVLDIKDGNAAMEAVSKSIS